MSDEKLPTDEHPGVDPTNASLAAQNRKILQGLARLEKLIEDPSPTPVEIANHIDDALREDAERDTPKFSDFGRLFLNQLDMEIRCPRAADPSEAADPEAELETEEPTGPVIDYIPVSWEEYGKRINASLAKCAEADRKAEMIDAVMAAGMLAVTDKGAVALALAEVFATVLPDDGPMHEIPEGWAPVALAINPATGEFLTLAGPRSEPDGRIQALETMLARQFKSTVGAVVGAIREAGKPQSKPLANLEGSCPICRLGEVGKLGSNFECAKCGRLFCGKCGGVKGPAHENVNTCSCEGRTL